MVTNRTVSVRLKADVSDFVRGMAQARVAAAGLGRDLNTANDSTSWLVGSMLALAPAAVPIGATIVPAVAALATQAGLAAAAGGVMALAFVGVGDGLKALNDYQLDPTNENLEKLHEAMTKLGPDGAEFVKFLDSVGPQFNELRLASRAGMFPGVEDGIEAFMERLPDLKRVVSEIATTIGQLSTEAGEGLAGPEFDAFFDFLKTDASPILLDTGRALGNFIDGLFEMTVAFGPTTRDFSAGFLDMSRRFEEWSEGLSSSQSFQEFIAYVREVTPQVKAFIGQLVDTFVDLAKAAAPVGEAMLPLLTGLLNIVGEIADTPLGSVLIAVTAISSLAGRLIALKNLASGGIIGSLLTGQFVAVGRAADDAGKKVAASGTAATIAGGKWRAAGSLGLLALGSGLTTIETESQNANAALGILGNTAMGAGVGSLFGPWGTAIGAAGGAIYGVIDAVGDAEAATLRAQEAADAWREAFPTESDVKNFENFQKLLLDPGAEITPVREDKPRPIKLQKPGQQKVVTKFETIGAQASVQQATRVARAANMTPRNVRTWLRTIGWSPVRINAVVRELERARSLARVRSQLSLTGWSPEKIDIAVKALENARSKKDVRATLTKKGFETKEIDQIIELLDVVGLKKPEPKATLKDEATARLKGIVTLHDSLDGRETESTHTTHYETTGTPPKNRYGGAIQRFAGGGFPWDSAPRLIGAIHGPGTGTSDSIPALLSNGEHVMTASEVQKVGGQAAVYRMRQNIQRGALQFANGGGSSSPARGSGQMIARLADTRVHIGGDGLARLVDDRVLVTLGAVETHNRQAMGRRRVT